MSPALTVDVAIAGGGIAGLWLLGRLRRLGYSALLIEADALGAGQTLCSQGIIHGGSKYALTGQLSAAAEAIASMPQRWRRCLEGCGEIDLTAATVLSDHQYLATGRSFGSKLAGFFAGKTMHSRMAALSSADYPAALRHPDFRGGVYRLDEPVLDVASVVRCLAGIYSGALLQGRVRDYSQRTKTLTIQTVSDDDLIIQVDCAVFTAGSGNAGLSAVAMQRRPLHMVLARGAALPPLYLHCLGLSDTPRITITSHRDNIGTTVWYLGGQLAESGVERDDAAQINATRRELIELLPWIDLSEVEFSTLRIERAEAAQAHGKRPDGPELFLRDGVITAWPTKLALAPLLTDRIIARLEGERIEPRLPMPDLPVACPPPPVSLPPWQQPQRLWR